VFACYSRWAIKRKIPPGSELAFKRRFLAATQEYNIEVGVERQNGVRSHVYRGIKLTDSAQRYVNSIVSFDEGDF